MSAKIITYVLAVATFILAIIGTAGEANLNYNMWKFPFGGAAKAFSLIAVFSSFGACVGLYLHHQGNALGKKTTVGSFGLTAILSLIAWIAYLASDFGAVKVAFFFQMLTMIFAAIGTFFALKLDDGEPSQPKNNNTANTGTDQV